MQAANQSGTNHHVLDRIVHRRNVQQVQMAVFAIEVALMAGFLLAMLRPFLALTQREVRSVAELLSQLPSEVSGWFWSGFGGLLPSEVGGWFWSGFGGQVPSEAGGWFWSGFGGLLPSEVGGWFWSGFGGQLGRAVCA
jgi:hypothetical protein